eukprot:CAMPEP_0194372150 /NCGR_PEP_ID=MMETSP0174-20130528/20455_1 /TAXON_ID=216777 /ORGANISM="Proboscia alata, Strain PI-D3" /LENGTH=183 /DNA_ID=CAMNT_0039150489 /DNA_START=198 /DNA_END=746 /DNA_ORIENTATION=+
MREQIKKELLLVAKRKFEQDQKERKQMHGYDLAAPISPSPTSLISSVLLKLNLDQNSLLFDMGCGDGRWMIQASMMSGCRCIGCDLDEKRLQIATENIEAHKLSGKIKIYREDVFKFASESKDLSYADVIVLYLFRDSLKQIENILFDRFKCHQTDQTRLNKAEIDVEGCDQGRIDDETKHLW